MTDDRSMCSNACFVKGAAMLQLVSFVATVAFGLMALVLPFAMSMMLGFHGAALLFILSAAIAYVSQGATTINLDGDTPWQVGALAFLAWAASVFLWLVGLCAIMAGLGYGW